MNIWHLAALSALLSLPAYSSEVPEEGPTPRDEKFELFLRQCKVQYELSDASIDRAGVRDAGYAQIPGFPYVRTDRFMSSFRNELKDLNTVGAWMLQMREYDSIARDIELANMGMSKYERAGLLNDLRVCAVWMSYSDLDDPATMRRLLDAAQVPDEYAEGAPQRSPELLVLAANREQAVKERFALPLKAPASKTRQVLWKPPAAVTELLPKSYAQLPRDELGRVGLLMNVWPQLAARHAPSWLTEAADDVIGAPLWVKDRPAVDVAKPVVYYLPGYARVQGRLLMQLIYFAWLPARDGDALDGLIWRVTLGDDGEPLLYDTIRANGLDHLWFPAVTIKPRTQAGGELPLVPQALPSGPFAVRLSSGSHDIRRLQSLAQVAAVKVHRYELRPYEDLLNLPAGKDQTHSLFGPDGIVAATGIRTDTALANSGIPHVGAVREWGRHASALTSRQHFDDPALLDALFEWPAPPKLAATTPVTPSP